MDQIEKIKLLETQIKNLEKIIELQDQLIINQNQVSWPIYSNSTTQPIIHPYTCSSSAIINTRTN